MNPPSETEVKAAIEKFVATALNSGKKADRNRRAIIEKILTAGAGSSLDQTAFAEDLGISEDRVRGVVHEVNERAEKFCVEQRMTFEFVIYSHDSAHHRDFQRQSWTPESGYGVGVRSKAAIADGGAVAAPGDDVFWTPYLQDESRAVRYVFGVPLFWKKDSLYVRDLDSRDPNDPQYRGQYTPSFNYYSAGDVHCFYNVFRHFAQGGALKRFFPTPAGSFHWNRRFEHVILVGSAMTNIHIGRLRHPGFHWHIGDRDILDARTKQPVKKQEMFTMKEIAFVYVARTRHQSLGDQGLVTVVAGNQGRAIEGAGLLLTRPKHLSERLAAGNWTLPGEFQMLLGVPVPENEDGPRLEDVEIIDLQPLEGASWQKPEARTQAEGN